MTAEYPNKPNDDARDPRIRVRQNTAGNGLVVSVGAASWYTGPMRYKLWRAARYLALLDRHGVRP